MENDPVSLARMHPTTFDAGGMTFSIQAVGKRTVLTIADDAAAYETSPFCTIAPPPLIPVIVTGIRRGDAVAKP
jgi:hypothetical protein